MAYKVSVVVPVYNSEKYLRECIESVIGERRFAEYELLLTDDGSTDGSAELIKEYRKYDNIHLLRYAAPPWNRGVSAARNLALQEARGAYIFFLDSDDTIEPDYISALLAAAEGDDLDVAYGSFCRCTGETREAVRYPLPVGAVVSGEALLRLRLEQGDKNNYIWQGLYKRSFLDKNHLRFCEERRLFEDILFTLRVQLCAERVESIPHGGYLHRFREDSLVGELRTRDVEEALGLIENIKALSERLAVRSLYPAVSMCLWSLGVLAENGTVTKKARRDYQKRLRSRLPWWALWCAAENRKEKVKWLVWRFAMNGFYRLVKK